MRLGRNQGDTHFQYASRRPNPKCTAMAACSAGNLRRSQNGETLEHRLDADKNEHHAADNLRAIAQQMAEALADG